MADAHRKTKLPELGTDNYDTWIRRAKNLFFSQDWLMFYFPVDADGDDTEAAFTAALAGKRRAAWGAITESLNDDILANVDDVEDGHVEALLRAIRACYFRNTAQSKSQLKDQLHSVTLDDHATLTAYISHIHTLVKKLAGVGYTVPADDKQYYLLKGLPADYAVVVQSIKMPRPGLPALTWEEIKFQLNDFADNPDVPGSISTLKAKAADRVHSSADRVHSSEDLCRDFAKGMCRRGNGCRFIHVAQPHLGAPPPAVGSKLCSYCGMTNHLVATCNKKRRDDAAKSSASRDRSYAAMESELAAIKKNLQPLTADDELSFVTTDIVSDACLASVPPAGGTYRGVLELLIDGGSTCTVIRDATRCHNHRPACINIKVGGGTVTCTQIADFRSRSRSAQRPMGA